MKLYPENYDVALDVLFTDNAGQPLAVTDVSAALFNGDDIEIHDFGQIVFDQADGKVTVTVPAEFNVLGEGELTAARILRVFLGVGMTVYTRSLAYIVENNRLEILNNTFLTLEAAEVLARDNPSLKAWMTADDDKKTAALINAYSRLSRIQLRYFKPHPEEDVATTTRPYDPRRSHREDCDVVIRPGDWGRRFVKDDFLAMPADFRKALRTAQLLEANEILTDDPIAQRHRNGIISETVGESSVMLRAGKLELGVGSETLRALTGFVYYRVRTARA